MSKALYDVIEAKTRKVKKVYGVVPNFFPAALPNGYTHIEYIESTGTQYINTGFVPNQDSRVVLDAQIMKAANASDTHCYFGCRDATNKKFFEIYNTSSVNFDIYFLWGTTYTQRFSVDLLKRRTVEINKNTAIVDGASYSYTPVNFNVGYPIYIGADNNSGSPNAITPMRTYACQMYDNGALARDFVPCINPSGEVGLYDLVTAAFFGNAGTGAFTAGASYQVKTRKIKKSYDVVGGVTRQFFSADLIAYTGAFTASDVTIDGVAHKLYTLTGSGTLTILEDASNAKIWLCGGGAGGAVPTNSTADLAACHNIGGGGGYVNSGELDTGTYTIAIASGGARKGAGGATTILSGDTTLFTAKGGNADGSGGSGGGRSRVTDTWPVCKGAGKSTYPFGLEELKAHCAGGGSGAVGASIWSFAGGAGGSNGSNGGAGSRASAAYGAGGSYGGGRGGKATYSSQTSTYTVSSAANGSFYGAGGGGAAVCEKPGSDLLYGSSGKGSQGVVYIAIPA